MLEQKKAAVETNGKVENKGEGTRLGRKETFKVYKWLMDNKEMLKKEMLNREQLARQVQINTGLELTWCSLMRLMRDFEEDLSEYVLNKVSKRAYGENGKSVDRARVISRALLIVMAEIESLKREFGVKVFGPSWESASEDLRKISSGASARVADKKEEVK